MPQPIPTMNLARLTEGEPAATLLARWNPCSLPGKRLYAPAREFPANHRDYAACEQSLLAIACCLPTSFLGDPLRPPR